VIVCGVGTIAVPAAAGLLSVRWLRLVEKLATLSAHALVREKRDRAARRDLRMVVRVLSMLYLER
jgi:hypothetical protein